jgi:hypothetical protein
MSREEALKQQSLRPFSDGNLKERYRVVIEKVKPERARHRLRREQNFDYFF